MLIAVNDVTGCLVVRPASRCERTLARLRADSLDRKLAAGAAAESHALLAVRAAVLVRPAVRLRFAKSLQAVIHAAVVPDPRGRSVLSVTSRRYIRSTADLIATLIEGLLAAYPVSACGMARVKILLTDGAGPLYYPANADQLRHGVQAAIDGLNAPLTW